MKRKFRNTMAVLGAAAALSVTGAASAATLSIGNAAPAVDGLDIANMAAWTHSEKFWTDTRAVGQTFTMGVADAMLNAITVQQAAQISQPTKNYTLTIGEVSGNTYTSILATETATQSVSSVSGDYWTYTLDTPIMLSANGVYGFDLGMDSSTSGWPTGIPYLAVVDGYAGGSQFRSTVNKTSTSPFSFIGRDKVFHLDLSAVQVDEPAPVTPEPTSAALAGLALMGLMARRRK